MEIDKQPVKCCCKCNCPKKAAKQSLHSEDDSVVEPEDAETPVPGEEAPNDAQKTETEVVESAS
jgi:hypothetical protein